MVKIMMMMIMMTSSILHQSYKNFSQLVTFPKCQNAQKVMEGVGVRMGVGGQYPPLGLIHTYHCLINVIKLDARVHSEAGSHVTRS